ncbi:MAG: VC0807 family protein [Bdellovibrionota bacterium]
MHNQKDKPEIKKENSFSHILFSILIPVLILNKGHKYGLDAKYSLVLALSFPLFLTLKSLLKSKKWDFVSLLGLLNVLFSGVLTLLTLDGIWFAWKEASFPLLIGFFVLASSYTKNPFFQALFLNPSTFDVDKVEERLDNETKKQDFFILMKVLTRWLSLSFLLSAFLNFVLAVRIFIPLDQALTDVQKQELLNEQLSQMTLYSLGVILVPSMIFLGALLYYSFKKINSLTGLNVDDLLKK